MKIILLSLSTLLLTACAHRTQTSPADNPQAAQITFADTLHDFGTIPADNALQRHRFIFKNTGNMPVAVVDVSLSCHCLAADYTRGIVQPGDTGHVTLTYDGRGTEGYFNKKARVRFNSPRIHELWVRGEVVTASSASSPASATSGRRP